MVPLRAPRNPRATSPLSSACFVDFRSSDRAIGRSGKAFEPQDLMGHHFFVVRAMEGGEASQDKIAKEFFETCEEYDA